MIVPVAADIGSCFSVMSAAVALSGINARQHPRVWTTGKRVRGEKDVETVFEPSKECREIAPSNVTRPPPSKGSERTRGTGRAIHSAVPRRCSET